MLNISTNELAVDYSALNKDVAAKKVNLCPLKSLISPSRGKCTRVQNLKEFLDSILADSALKHEYLNKQQII